MKLCVRRQPFGRLEQDRDAFVLAEIGEGDEGDLVVAGDDRDRNCVVVDPVGQHGGPPADHARVRIGAGEIGAGADQKVGLLEAPGDVVAAQPYGDRRRGLDEGRKAGPALLGIRTQLAIVAQTGVLETESPVIMQGDDGSATETLRFGDQVGAEPGDVVKMDDLHPAAVDDGAQPAGGGRPMEVSVRRVGLHGEAVDAQAIDLVDAQRSAFETFARNGAGQNGDLKSPLAQGEGLTVRHHLGPADGLRREVVGHNKDIARHAFPRTRERLDQPRMDRSGAQ